MKIFMFACQGHNPEGTVYKACGTYKLYYFRTTCPHPLSHFRDGIETQLTQPGPDRAEISGKGSLKGKYSFFATLT